DRPAADAPPAWSRSDATTTRARPHPRARAPAPELRARAETRPHRHAPAHRRPAAADPRAARRAAGCGQSRCAGAARLAGARADPARTAARPPDWARARTPRAARGSHRPRATAVG